MRLTIVAAALLAAVPAIAQVKSPFLGALPNTIILDGGWQMTPQTNRCMLTHRGPGSGQDFAIIAPLHDQTVILALILPNRQAFSAPVQLTVIAEGETSEPAGRVTFNPTSGALGTLLMANWPADSLLPRVARASRLAFYTPDQRLLRSVALAGIPQAIDVLNQCRGVVTPAKRTPTGDGLHPAIDVGWVPQSDRDGCGVSRMTRNGNEIGLRYTRRSGVIVVYRMNNGSHYDQDEAVPVRFGFWQSGNDGAPIELTAAALSLTMHSTNPGDGPVLFAAASNQLLTNLRLSDLSALTIQSPAAPAGRVDDIANLEGSRAAVFYLSNCAKRLSR